MEPARRVLSVRCHTGILLKAVQPSHGVGVEISSEMIEVAARQNPEFVYKLACPDTDDFLVQMKTEQEPFDYIIFGDIDDTVDVQRALKNLLTFCQRQTRLLIITYNHLWEPLVTLAEWLGMKVPGSNKTGCPERMFAIFSHWLVTNGSELAASSSALFTFRSSLRF